MKNEIEDIGNGIFRLPNGELATESDTIKKEVLPTHIQKYIPKPKRTRVKRIVDKRIAVNKNKRFKIGVKFAGPVDNGEGI